MRVLDLFAGLRGWSEQAESRGHEVVSIDNDERFDVTLHADLSDVASTVGALRGMSFTPDIILASPPCESFSVMTIGRNWDRSSGRPEPKTEKAELAIRLVRSTLEIIDILRPSFWVIENPRAMLRKMEFMSSFDRRTVTYCQYGSPYMKPTDLWGGFPPSLELLPMCSPRSDCHTPAPRGSTTGTQGSNELLSAEAQEWLDGLPPRKSKTFRGGMLEEMARFPSWSPERKTLTALRAKIPGPLALSVIEAAECDLEAGLRAMPTTLWGE